MELRPRLTVATVVPAAILERLVALESAALAVPVEHQDLRALRVVVVTVATVETALLESIPICQAVTVAKAELVVQLEMAAPVAQVARRSRPQASRLSAVMAAQAAAVARQEMAAPVALAAR